MDKSARLDLIRPDGSDHDRNTYCYRLRNGTMGLKGIILGAVIGPFEPKKLSCYIPTERTDIDMAYKPAPRPTDIELEKIYREGGYTINCVKEHFCTGWKMAKKWLHEAGLIDEYGTRIIRNKEPARSMGCVEESESTAPTETCCRCGKQLLFTRVWRDGKKYCTDCDIEMTYGKEPEPIAPGVIKDAIDLEPHNHHINQVAPIGVEVPQYSPEDNDFRVEDEDILPPAISYTFDSSGFKLELIQNTIELSELRNAPKSLTLDLINGIIGV